MNFLNKIFASSHNRSSFQIEDVSGSEEDQDEIPEQQEIPQFKKQNIQLSQNYNQRKKPLPKMGQADFLARYDENFDDVFGDKPVSIDIPKGKKRRQEEDQEDENDNENERKSQKKKTQSRERKQQSKEQKEQQKESDVLNRKFKENKSTSLDYQDIYDMKDIRDIKEPIEPKSQKESKVRLPKFPKSRKRIANNHLSTLRSNSNDRDSISNKDKESIQRNNKYNPNDIALPQTALPKSERKQDKQKTMVFTFGMNNDNNDSEKDIQNQINNIFQNQKELKDLNSNNDHSKEKKNQDIEQKIDAKKKQRKEIKEKEKISIKHSDEFNQIKEILKNVNSKQNSEQRETRKLNSEQRERQRKKKRVQKKSKEKDEKINTNSPSPELKLIQFETQKRVKRSHKRVVEDLQMLVVDEISLNPNIVECKPNLYLDYIPVYD